MSGVFIIQYSVITFVPRFFEMKTTHNILKALAAVTWYAGGGILLWKGSKLAMEAYSLRPGELSVWVSVGLGLFAGAVKVRFIFSRTCRKNLVRIDKLIEPRLWQFFRPRFFVFLTLMITLGSCLSRLSHGNYVLLLCVAVLDLSISTALLGSSYVFWKSK
ncbi:hypothetical protein BVX94_03545 [bacterium B17]|nr:hypothetical protein BVX94_03545 [bacterium B17]